MMTEDDLEGMETDEGAGKRKTCLKHLLYAWQLLEHKRIDTG